MKMDCFDGITTGVAYYPEHWAEGLWEDDVRRMLESGITVLRIGDFVWSKYEPREGEYAIGYYDRFLDLCARLGMKVIFCTPTAAPPVWMSHKYPEILNCDVSGRPYSGPRRHYNYNSPVYRDFCARLVRRLGEHYGSRREIVAWQIDNELNCDLNEFYSEADNAAYRDYLKEKFGTLEKLNEALGLTFWSREYGDWDEIRLCGMSVGGAINPQQALEEKRFFSESAISFCKMQARELRPYLHADALLTTNGLFGNLDYNRLMDEAGLDFMTYDSYPNFAYELSRPEQADDMKDRKWSRSLMWTRSASPAFGIMEQQAGANGWSSRMETPAPHPGQMRLWALQSVAHGADFVSFFRWRTSPIGCEIYWHGLNDYDNLPNRRMEELKRFTDDMASLAPVCGARVCADVAVLHDYDNDMDAEADLWHGRVARQSEDAWFKATQRSHTPCDFLYLRPGTTADELARYKMLVYPHAAITEERTGLLLKEYVRQGGILVLGARTGYKDATGRCLMRTHPWLAGDWCGARAVDFTLVHPSEAPVTITMGGQAYDAPVLLESLAVIAPDAQALGRFDGGDYAGEPAVIVTKHGEGQVYTVGACFGEALADALLERCGLRAPYADILRLPACVELTVRRQGGARYLFALNYSDAAVDITLNKPMTDLLTGKAVEGRMSLPKYGVAVFRQD